MTRAKQNLMLESGRATLRGGIDEGGIDRETQLAIERARDHMAARKQVDKYLIRAAVADDDNYILDNWTRSYLFSDVTRPVPRDVYNVEQRARIARILRYSKVMCAVDPHDKRRIKGWICFQAAVSENHWVTVHYLCVHPSLQNQGIGNHLLGLARLISKNPEDPIWITHWTLPMRRLVDKWNLIYNPYLLEVLHVYD